MSGVKDRYERRRKRLLEIGRDLVVEEGLAGLSIENIASVEGCSRPTVYQHFKDRDDAFEQVARNALAHAGKFMQLASQCQGDTRAQMIAHMTCHELMGRFHPAEFNIVEYLSYPWVQKKFSNDLLLTYTKVVETYMQLLTRVVEQALKNGELPEIPGGLTASQFSSHLLSLINGIITTIVKQRLAHQISKPVDEWDEARQMIITFFNGFNWKPILTERNEAGQYYYNLIREVFPEHWVQIETEKLQKQVLAVP